MATTPPSRLALRLGALSREELLELVVEEAAKNRRFRSRADALVSRRHPLPTYGTSHGYCRGRPLAARAHPS